MKSLVCPELPTASLGSSQATTAAVGNSAPLATYLPFNLATLPTRCRPIAGVRLSVLIARNLPVRYALEGRHWSRDQMGPMKVEV